MRNPRQQGFNRSKLYQAIILGCSAFALAGASFAQVKQGQYIAIGEADETQPEAYAAGEDAIAIGSGSSAAYQGVAIGTNSLADKWGATAFGYGAMAWGTMSSAWGFSSNANGDNSLAFGPYANAGSLDSIAMGNGAQSQGAYALAFGSGSSAIGGSSAVFGQGAAAYGIGGVAFGNQAYATYDGGVAIGQLSASGGNGAVAIGSIASATGSGGVAIGQNTTASHANAVALGAGSVTDRANSVSFGTTYYLRTLTNVAPGTQENDAATMDQLAQAGLWAPGFAMKTAVTYDSNSFNAVTFTNPSVLKNVANGAVSSGSLQAVNGGQLWTVRQDAATANTTVAGQVTALGTRVSALESAGGGGGGGVDQVRADYFVLGNRLSATSDVATTTGDEGVAIGRTSIAGDHGAALGYGSQASGSNAVALGYSARATSFNDVALGYQAIASGGASVAAGTNASATGISSVAIGEGSQATGAFTFAVGSTMMQRKIVNVSPGSVDTDAATMKNLKDAGLINASNQKLKAATYDATGSAMTLKAGTVIKSLTAGSVAQSSTDAVNGDQLWTVRENAAAASTAIQGQVTGLDTRLTALESSGGGGDFEADLEARLTALGLSDGAGNNKPAVAYDYGTESEISLTGASGTYIHNLADGEVSATSMDAVNGRQLHAVQQALADESVYWDDRMASFSDQTDTTYQNMGLMESDGTVRKALTYDPYTSEGQITLSGFFGTKITNLAPGDVTVSSTDAVTGGQLFAVQNHLNGVADTTNMLFDQLTDINNGVWSALEVSGLYDADTGDVSKAVSYAFGNDSLLTLAGAGGTRITNLAAGTISAGSTDAVTGGQVASIRDALQTSIDTVDARVDGISAGGPGADPADVAALTTRVDGIDTQISGIGTRIDTEVATIGSRVDGVDARIDTRVDGLQSTISTRLDGVDTSLSNLSTGLSTLSQDTRNYLTNAGLMDGLGNVRLAVSYDHGDGSSLTLAGLGGTLLTNLASGSIAPGSTDAITGGQVDAIRTELKGDIAGLDNRVDGLESGTPGGGGGGLDDLEDSIAAVDGRVDSLSTQVGNNYQQFVDSGLVDGSGNVLAAATYDLGTSYGVMSFRGAGGTLLSNVAPGRIGAGSMEAVNGGQIDALRSQLQGQIDGLDGRVSNVEAGGGSGGTIDPAQLSEINGKISSLDGRVSTVEGGLIATNDRIDSMQSGGGAVTGPIEAPQQETKPAPTATGDGAIAAGSGAKATADNTVALGTDSVADRANTVSVGSAGNERQVTNVAKGEAATDAVNMSQLNEALAASYARTEERINDVWTQLNHRVDEASRQANKGIASAAALVSNMPYVPGATTVNAGVANYRGENAMGLGVSRWNESGTFNVNAGVSQAEGDSAIVRIGVGLVF